MWSLRIDESNCAALRLMLIRPTSVYELCRPEWCRARLGLNFVRVYMQMGFAVIWTF